MISWWIMYPTVPTLPQKPKKVLGFLDTKMDRPSLNHNVLNGIEFLIIELVPKLYIPTTKCDEDHFLIRWSFQTIGVLFIKMKGSIENFIIEESIVGSNPNIMNFKHSNRLRTWQIKLQSNITPSIQTQVPIVKVEPKLDPTLEKWTLGWVKVLKSGIPNPPPPRGPPIPLTFYYFTMYSFVASLKNGSGDMGCIIFNAVASCCLHLKIEKARTKV